MQTLCLDLSKPQADAWLITLNDETSLTEKLCTFDNPFIIKQLLITAEVESVSTDGVETIVTKEEIPAAEITLPGMLADAIAPYRARLDQILVITDGSKILSRSVKLPFADAKRVAQLLIPEVTDQVPFELDTFVIAPGIPTPISEGFLFPILVIENSKLTELLSVLQVSALNANEIILPSTLLVEDTTNALSTATAALLQSGDYLYVRLLTPIRSLQRIITYQNPARMLQELRQTLLFFERESGLTIKRLSANCDDNIREHLQRNLPEQFEQQYHATPLIDLVTQSLKTKQALETLRVGKFSYHVKLGGLLRSFSGSLPYAALGILLVIFGIFGLSVARSNATEDLQSASANTIKKAAPELASVENSAALGALQKKNKDLDQELQTLGSPSKFSPLAVLKSVSTDFPTSDSITVTGLKIRGDELTLEGNAPDYAAVEKIQGILRSKRSTFCNVSKDDSNSTQGKGRGFTFTIKLCD